MEKLFYSKFSNALRFFSLWLLFTVFNSSGEVRCDLTMKSCLDYNATGEFTLSVPKNATRIAKDTVRLCMPTFSVNTTVDFVFAVDQSASMDDPISDPDFLTPVATTRAINVINTLSPTSTVGFFGFSNGICDGQQKESITGQGNRFSTKPDTRVTPAPLNGPGHKDKLLAQTNYNSKDFHFGCGSIQPGGTNYNRAFRTAQSWLDTLSSPHKDVIIFITDGEQTTEQTAFTDLVNSADSTFPIVYALFLRDTAGNSDEVFTILFKSRDLISLTEKTGGGFHFVGNAGLVDSVMQKIIQETIQVGSPSSTIVTNTTNGSKALGINQKSGGKDNEYQMSLDSIIALNLNKNSVAFSTSNDQNNYSKNVTINVDAPAITAKGKTALSNELFDAFCYDKSTLIPTNKNFQPINVVTFQMDAIGVVLQTSSDIPNNQVVGITSAGTADETLVLDTNNRNTINFAIGPAQPANSIVEGNGGDSLGMFWANPRDPRDNAEASLPISEAPEMQSWIIDGDGDGRADSVFIEFVVKIPTIPNVSNIHWPDNNSEVKSGVANPSGPELNSVRFFNYLQTIIVVDLSQDQFEFGATSASTDSPPTLTAFKTPIPIQDSVKPFLISAVKKPSDHGRYMRLSDSSTTNFPDTLTITLSEPITPVPNATAPWTSLLLVKKDYDLIPVVVLKELKVLSEDKRTYQVIFENKPGDKSIKAGDTISLNPEAFYLDTKGNTMNPMAVELTGYDNTNSGLCTAWRGGPVSGDQEEFTSFSTCPQIPVVNETNNTIVGYVATANVEGWVPPVGFDHKTGNIDFSAQTNDLCFEPLEARTKTRFPTECFASRLLLTEFSNGPYIAHINIYDHLGTFIRHLKQAFGFCGELYNPERATESGLILNDLVWNLQDINGDKVGTGVYIWQVRLRFSKGGHDKVRVYKMGYLSKGNDLNTPCTSGQ